MVTELERTLGDECTHANVDISGGHVIAPIGGHHGQGPQFTRHVSAFRQATKRAITLRGGVFATGHDFKAVDSRQARPASILGRVRPARPGERAVRWPTWRVWS